MLISVSYGQDPVWSQYATHPELLNPAFTGGRGGANVYAVYRHQYPSLPGRYETIAIGGGWFYPELRSGFGLSVLYDDSADGLYRSLAIDGQYAYHVDFGEDHYLSLGVTLGYGRTDVAPERFIFPDQLDPILGAISPGGLPLPTDELLPADDHMDFLDIGAGLLYYEHRFYAGIAFQHLNNPANDFFTDPTGNSSVDGLPMRWTIHAGATVPLVEEGREPLLTLFPRVFYTRQRDFGQLNARAAVRYRSVECSVGGRLSNDTADALLLGLGYAVDRLRFYYNYDVTISSLASRSGGAHEVGISYQIREAAKHTVDCFDFF